MTRHAATGRPRIAPRRRPAWWRKSTILPAVAGGLLGVLVYAVTPWVPILVFGGLFATLGVCESAWYALSG